METLEISWKIRLRQIIFQSDTPLGRLFDLSLLAAIVLSVIVVLVDSVPVIYASHHDALSGLEWFFTILFTVEYLMRIYVAEDKKKYIFSAFGVIDFLSIVPAYLGVFYSDYQFLLVFRSLRLLRVFKILKLSDYMRESNYIIRALYNSYRKIMLFMMFILIMALIIGSVAYIVEKDTPGFESIPKSIYWAAVTITTVGYGDITPITPVGKILALIVMICGYSIIAVPTGIVTTEMARGRKVHKRAHSLTKHCPGCGYTEHDYVASYCLLCGEKLEIKKMGEVEDYDT